MTHKEDTADAATDTPSTRAPASTTWEQVTLDEPIVRGNKTIDTVNIRKPKSGELRRLALSDVARMEVDALATLLPRITEPALTAHEVQALDPADLMQCGTKVAGFLLPKGLRDDSGA